MINWIIKVWEMQTFLVAIVMLIDYETDGDYDFDVSYFWRIMRDMMTRNE